MEGCRVREVDVQMVDRQDEQRIRPCIYFKKADREQTPHMRMHTHPKVYRKHESKTTKRSI